MNEPMTGLSAVIHNHHSHPNNHSTFQDLGSGANHLFRHPAPEQETGRPSVTAGINNYIKSPEEIEAELRQLSSNPAESQREGMMVSISAYSLTSGSSLLYMENDEAELMLPDYMEENY